MALKSFGSMAVDWEARVDFDRTAPRATGAHQKAAQAVRDGALLCFDMQCALYHRHAYWHLAQDKINRFTLLPQDDGPILWDFGSAAKHHQLYAPWLGEGRSRPGISLLRGAMSPEMGRAEDVAKKIKRELSERGLDREPLGVDVAEVPVLFALQKEGLTIVDGQQLMSEARLIKTEDEITLLNIAAAQVDAAYDELYRAMKPGMKENEAVGLVSKVLYDLGSEYVEAVNAISGERCNPHPHVFPDRMLRPGDPVYYDILQSYMGYRTCYYRCFTVAMPRTRWSMPISGAASISTPRSNWCAPAARPGHCRRVAQGDRVWVPERRGGVRAPVRTRRWTRHLGKASDQPPVSLEHPVEIKPGMVFALETFWPSTDGWSAARIEEEVVVTENGHEIITPFLPMT